MLRCYCELNCTVARGVGYLRFPKINRINVAQILVYVGTTTEPTLGSHILDGPADKEAVPGRWTSPLFGPHYRDLSRRLPGRQRRYYQAVPHSEPPRTSPRDDPLKSVWFVNVT